MLFLGEGDSKLAAAFAGAVKGTPVLVVGDSSKSLEEGAMIAFLLDDNKVRFEVNLDNAEKAKLRISAKLLALAKGVVGGAKRGA